MSSVNNRRKKAAKKILIYARYVLPIVFCFAMIGTTFVPCLKYLTYAVDGTNAPISSADLFQSSWDTVRTYLFSGGETKPDEEKFAKILLVLLIVIVILFALGFISTVITAICAFRYMYAPDDGSDVIRMWFITIIPNRIVTCLLYALTLPLLFLSRMVIPLFDGMDIEVLLKVSAPEPWVWGLIFFGITVALTIISSFFEKDMGLNVFKKRIPTVIVKEREDSDDGAFVIEPKTEEERIEYEARKREREEQNELIRKLLSNKDNTNNQ